jgi:hypothetical protein
MRFWREINGDLSARSDKPALRHNAHHPADAPNRTIGVPEPKEPQQSVFELIDLNARIPQPCYLYDGVWAQLNQCSSRQTEQVDPLGRDVLTKVTGTHLMASIVEVVEQL